MNTGKLKIELGPVQETLLVPLLSRAKEFKKDFPLLADIFAKEIIDKIDYDFSSLDSMMDDGHQIVWILRAHNFDNSIKEFLKRHNNALVVNIGAGLDTTFQRVDNRKMFWVNLDLPDVIDLRQKLIPDSDRETCISKSIFDRSWVNEVKQLAQGRSVLFISAGVFCYFDQEKMRLLFQSLSNAFPSSELIFDAMSRFAVWGANRSIMKKSGMDSSAILTWYLKKPSMLKKWVSNLEFVDNYAMFSRIPDGNRLDKRALRDMRIADKLGLYKIIHCKF